MRRFALDGIRHLHIRRDIEAHGRLAAGRDRIQNDGVSYATTPSFNFAAIGVLAILIALYALFW